MSEEPIRKILMNIGLTEKETDVYIFLAKHGTLKGLDITKLTRMDKGEVYRILKSLQNKGLLHSTLEAPARFSAIPFDKVIDAFVKARKDEAALIESTKQDLMQDWEKISKTGLDIPAEKFVILEGKSKIYPRIFQLIKETNIQLRAILTVDDLLHIQRSGFFDAFIEKNQQSKIQLNLLTEISEKNTNTMKTLLKSLPQTVESFVIKTPDLGLRLSPRMVIKDDQEILFFITPNREITCRESQDETSLWTDCKTLVQSFTTVFSELWKHSGEMEKRILDLEAGKPSSILTIFDKEKTIEKYVGMICEAKEEIIMMTSWQDTLSFGAQSSLLGTLAKKGVSIKIMAPIADLDIPEALSQYCELRNCSETQLRTTLIDGQHLFQFKKTQLCVDYQQTKPLPERAMYTNRLEDVQKIRASLYDIWEKSCNPSVPLTKVFSNTTIGSILDESESGRSEYRKWLFNIKEREEGTLTEKDVINKMVQAKRIHAKDPTKDINVQYGSSASAIIHPPSFFNLPCMIISAHHENKQSSFGAEDWISISLWLETPKGFAYVPVAHATDNPKAAEWRKGVYAGTPAGRNSLLVRKNELKVTIQGNTLFAGWTIPIPLLLPRYVLPPVCLLFEGYGELKTNVLKSSLPSGRTQITEENSLKAFVTLFHQTSTYQGPGTDGHFNRERIMTAYPPLSNKK